MSQIRVIDESSSLVFESKVNELLKDGYVLKASNCGFVNSAQYDFCGSYQAILLKDDVVSYDVDDVISYDVTFNYGDDNDANKNTFQQSMHDLRVIRDLLIKFNEKYGTEVHIVTAQQSNSEYQIGIDNEAAMVLDKDYRIIKNRFSGFKTEDDK
jgi:hypothetical protein